MHNILRVTRLGYAILLMAPIMGCGSDTGGSPTGALSQSDTYWQLVLNQHAVTLSLASPYDTVRLRAHAVNPNGDSIATTGTVRYIASDSTVTVTSAGLMQAHFQTLSRGFPAYVIATLQDPGQNVTRSDTVFVQVTTTPPASPLTTLSLQPSTPGQVEEPMSDFGTQLTVNVTDASSTFMPNVLVSLTSSDTTIATITSRNTNNITDPGGYVTFLRPGAVTFYAITWAYGVTKRDSLRFTITIADLATVHIFSKIPYASTTPVQYFYPATVAIGRGGVVTWSALGENLYDPQAAIDVVFDDTTNIDSAAALNHPDYGFPYTGRGNFTGLYEDTVSTDDYDTYLFHSRKARKFPVAGTYHYHSAKYGSTGTVIVQ